jgi:valyl-tRNA synthetase
MTTATTQPKQPPLPKSYTPAEWEAQIAARWESAKAFHADPSAGGEPFCILIPPPNVTGALHLGHAFNNTLQDILVRYHRMRGFNTLWMPGTDHASISTQAVVEKRLHLQGKKRTDFTREEFIAKVQAWKDEYEATIIAQLKAMGCSCDFDRTRFTMDEVCTRAMREAFFRLFRDGLIYRGKRLVNWDPVAQTALSDDEVEMEEVQGHMCYLRYPLVHPPQNPDDPLDCQEVTWSELAARGYPGAAKHADDDRAWVTVATTRPETYLGDTAVAVNPKDPRATALHGLFVQLPLVGRVIPIIEDSYVVLPRELGGEAADAKSEFATGFLKVTPAHDPNDYEIGQRHSLPLINVFAPDATVSDKHGWSADDVRDARLFIGLSREVAREKVVAEFKARGLLESVRSYTHSVGHSERTHVPIEPYLSDQWYVKVTDDSMRGEALRAMAAEQRESQIAPGSPGAAAGGISMASPAKAGAKSRPGDGELRFFPERYARTFQSWHENLRDWCISRQLWWGHRIPVWSTSIPLPSGIVGEIKQLDTLVPDDIQAHEPWIATQYRLIENAIEVAYCIAPGHEDFEAELETTQWRRDPDVLDTWFSSALWPISTMGWPDPGDFPSEIPEGSALLERFNPSTVLLTAREIITLWVSRMVMFNRYFRGGTLPFRHVYIHAMIQDGHGQKMSKSLGNGVDPRDIVHSHGADALRFIMAQIATQTQDVRMPVDMACPHADCGETFEPREIITSAGYRVADVEQTCPRCKRRMISGYGAATGLATPTNEKPLARNSSRKFDEGRNFANKLWNVTRFALSSLSPHPQREGWSEELPLVDRWILSRLHRTLHIVEDALAEYQFKVYADAMYSFVWGDFCDWYIEAIKPTVKSNPSQQQVLRTVLNATLRLLHPIMPFVTEALWSEVASGGSAGLDGIELEASELAATAAWPDISCSVDDKAAAATFERVQVLVNAIRQIRSQYKVDDKRQIDLAAPAEIVALIHEAGGVVETLARVTTVTTISGAGASDGGSVPLTFEGFELRLSGLVNVVDAAAERSRLTKVIEEKQRAITGYQSKLSNEGYVSKARPEVVEETRRKLAEAEADLHAARNALQSLAFKQP